MTVALVDAVAGVDGEGDLVGPDQTRQAQGQLGPADAAHHGPGRFPHQDDDGQDEAEGEDGAEALAQGLRLALVGDGHAPSRRDADLGLNLPDLVLEVGVVEAGGLAGLWAGSVFVVEPQPEPVVVDFSPAENGVRTEDDCGDGQPRVNHNLLDFTCSNACSNLNGRLLEKVLVRQKQ